MILADEAWLQNLISRFDYSIGIGACLRSKIATEGLSEHQCQGSSRSWSEQSWNFGIAASSAKNILQRVRFKSCGREPVPAGSASPGVA